jgi:hypothetical protein
MATTVVGDSPITVVDPQTGAQHQIPLSTITFNQAGDPQFASNVPQTVVPVAQDFVRTLLKEGLLTLK